MGDCPGAGSGDPRDYDHRSLEEQRSERIRKAKDWIKEQGFEVVKIDTPKDKEYFVNYKIENGCSYYWFAPNGHYVKEKDRKILQTEYTPIYGTDEEATNFDEGCKYYIVKHKSNKSFQRSA